MTNHDLGVNAAALKAQSEALLKKISPEFSQLGADLNQILAASENPQVVAALLFKLVQERQETNRLINQMNEKYDSLMFEWKTQKTGFSPLHSQSEGLESKKNLFEVLPEQDQMILNLVDQKGSADAQTVRTALGYKGLNAACQRLNKLFKEGYLKKVQSGKKVLYLTNR